MALKPLLEWLDVKQPVPASGELPYQLRLELAAESSQLQIDSSLQGLRIDLPAPFGKAAGVRRDSTLRMSCRVRSDAIPYGMTSWPRWSSSRP